MGQASANEVATRFATPTVRADLSWWLVFQTRVAESTKERTGNLVAGLLSPLSPARVLEVMGGPKMEVSGWVIALSWGPKRLPSLNRDRLDHETIDRGETRGFK